MAFKKLGQLTITVHGIISQCWECLFVSAALVSCRAPSHDHLRELPLSPLEKQASLRPSRFPLSVCSQQTALGPEICQAFMTSSKPMLIQPTVSAVYLSRFARPTVVPDDRRSSPGLPMLQVYDLQAPLKVLHPSQIGWQLQQEPQAGPTPSRTSKGGRGTENAPPQQLTDGAHPPKQPPRRALGQQAALQGRSHPVNGAVQAGPAPAQRIQHGPFLQPEAEAAGQGRQQVAEGEAGSGAHRGGKVASGRQASSGLSRQQPAHRRGQDRPDAAVRHSSTSLALLASSR